LEWLDFTFGGSGKKNGFRKWLLPLFLESVERKKPFQI
jgi:hypothetical protein